MKKVLILSALVVLAGSATYAQTQNFLWTPNAPTAGVGEIYNAADIWNVDRPPRPLPIPSFDLPEGGVVPGKGFEFQSAAGPVAPMSASDKGGSLGAVSGSAIVTPRGGSFMTPRREADQQIKKLIGKLD